MSARITQVLAMVVLAAVVGFGVYARTTASAPLVFPNETQVRLLGIDAYYHVRHTQYAARNFPHVQRIDVGTHYPMYEVAQHPGLFNVSIAAVAIALSLGTPSDRMLEVVSAWSPVAFNALAVLALFLLCRRFWGHWPSVAACGLFALYPGLGHNRTLLGFADHHAAEVPLTLLIAWTVVLCLQRELRSTADGDVRPRSAYHPAIGYAAPMAVFVFTWPGAAMYLLIAGLAFVAVLVVNIARGDTVEPLIRAMARWAAGVVVWLVVVALVWPDFVLLPKIYYASIGAAAGMFVGVVALDKVLGRIGNRISGRVLAASLIAATVLALVAVALLDPSDQGLAANLTEKKSSLVADHQYIDFETFWAIGGTMNWLAVVGFGWAAVRVVKREDPLLWTIPVVFAVMVHVAAILTGDYGYMLPPFAAMLAAYAASLLVAAVPAHRALATVVAGVVLVAPSWPLGMTVPAIVDAKTIKRVRIVDLSWEQAMEWLRDNTPQPVPDVGGTYSSTTAAEIKGPSSYGVWVAWSYGNFVSYMARRIPTWSHGTSRLKTRWLVSKNETEANLFLCPKCGPEQSVRYVIVDAKSLGTNFMANVKESKRDPLEFEASIGTHSVDGETYPLRTYGEAYEQTTGVRLLLHDARGLGSYRLIYETPHKSFIGFQGRRLGPAQAEIQLVTRALETKATFEEYTAVAKAKLTPSGPDSWLYQGRVTPSIKIYEVVRGALISGTTDPLSRIDIRIELGVLTTRRKVIYETHVVADRSGQFLVRVPYPSAGQFGAVKALQQYQMSITRPDGTQSPNIHRFDVSERHVENGTMLQVGDLH